MPGHRVHDFLTVAAAGAAVPAYWALVDRPNGVEAAMLAGACLVSGLLFSPDLDLPSRPRRRWGPAAILWAPYEAFVPHRSWVSHHPLAGPLVRLGYFLAVLYGLLWAALWAIRQWIVPVNRNALVRGWRQELMDLARGHPRETALVLIGFLLGGLVHTAADVLWSRLRPRRRRRRRRR